MDGLETTVPGPYLFRMDVHMHLCNDNDYLSFSLSFRILYACTLFFFYVKGRKELGMIDVILLWVNIVAFDCNWQMSEAESSNAKEDATVHLLSEQETHISSAIDNGIVRC